MSQVKVIIGPDDLLLASEAAKTIGDGTGLEVIDSANSTNEELQLRDIAAVMESCQTPPFFDPRKVTWWKNVGFLPGGKKKSSGDGDDGERHSQRLSEAVKEALQKFAQSLEKWVPGENQALVITAPQFLQTSVMYKTLSAFADMKVFTTLKGEAARRDAVDRAISRAQSAGLSFAPGAADRFIEIVGYDERSILQEVEKLRSYLGESGVIAAKDIENITSPGVGVETPMWSVVDAITERNAAKAVDVARKFEGDAGFAVVMTTVIEKQLRLLVELKAADEEGCFTEAARSAGVGWKAGTVAAALKKWSLLELRTARLRFMNLRERAVSSSGSADAAVIVEILRTCRGRV